MVGSFQRYIHIKTPAPLLHLETRNALVSTRYKPFGKSIVLVSFDMVTDHHK
jgi:hypothetical protein